MYAYKLTTQDMKTRKGEFNEVQWEIGKKVSIKVEGNKLCSNQVIHSYLSPLLAVLLNPIHANLHKPRLFKARCTKVVATAGLMQGHKCMSLLSELEVPVVTVNQRIAFAILCSLEVEQSSVYKTWAEKWLSGRDRSSAAANAAYTAANASNAAYYTAYAAYTAVNAANAAYYAAYYATYYAAYAANAAARNTNEKIDFAALAEKAMQYR